MDNENNQAQNKNKNSIIIVLGISIIIAAIILTVALISVVSKSKDTKATTLYTLTTNDGKVTTTEGIDLNDILGGDASTSGDKPINNKTDKNIAEKTTKNKAVEFYEQLSPNGENVLSDHYNNKYIKMVEKKYKVDTDLLVAIYSEPDTGNNFVLEFSGKTDKDGNIIKSPDTLKKVYHIDKKGNITVATGTDKGNEGVSYAEGLLSFNMVKTIIMEQYPDYFTGLSK